ncbi:MAG: nucleoside triphosphate pyrophosphohydrolase [Chitinophagales bacterium]|nr:nucleoside triphosphate pyrophosphohydrolase [Chitinophagales bacterium]
MDERLKAFERLLNIMDDLREKCPWDKKQTINSLSPLTIEETYELCDAIIEKNDKAIQEELGDLMLHLVFYSKIASEENKFDITDVLNTVCEKLIFRHPHIYGDVKVETDEEVKQNWEKLKLKKGKKSILEGVPSSLPSVVKAQRVQSKASAVGFDWENAQQAFPKMREEMDELQEAIGENDFSHIEEEAGDLLFAVINYTRHLGVDAERALELTNKKFIKRFQKMEEYARTANKNIADVGFEQQEAWYQAARKELKQKND